MSTRRFYEIQMFWMVVLVLILSIGFHEVVSDGRPALVGGLASIAILLLVVGNSMNEKHCGIMQASMAGASCIVFLMGYAGIADPGRAESTAISGIVTLLFSLIIPLAFRIREARERAHNEKMLPWIPMTFYMSVPITYTVARTLQSLDLSTELYTALVVMSLSGFMFQILFIYIISPRDG